MENNRYYWLKLKRDFFKRHDIRIVEDMPNGKDYILFYLKMLVESVDHNGELRFSDTIPYNEDMIATITNTNIDIVRAAMQIFTKLEMIEIIDDGTIYMTEVQKMIGSASDNDNAKRQALYRQRKKAENALISVESVTKSNAEVTQGVTNDNESKNKSKSKSKSKRENIDIIVDKKPTRFIPPTIDEVRDYCDERGNDVDPEKFISYYESNGWMVGRNHMKDWKAAIRTWEKNSYGKPLNSSPSYQKPSGNPFADLLEKWEDEDE